MLAATALKKGIIDFGILLLLFTFNILGRATCAKKQHF